MLRNEFKVPMSLLILGLGLLGSFWYPSRSYNEIHAQSGHVQFAVIGDYGSADQAEQDVANLVKSWNPDFIITTGDNNYPDGSVITIDQNIGQYYHDFIFPYVGTYGAGASFNRFFPALGNHDWDSPGAMPYLNYFVLPGNERYYDFSWQPIQFFVLDSDSREPDGNSSTSVQARWLESRLAASSAIWKLVEMHHPPYSSGAVHGSTLVMQWPYPAWGASAILASHDHEYERILKDGVPYFVNGLGGGNIYPFATPVPGSQVRYNGDYGAMLVEANNASITFRFISRKGTVIDTYTLNSAPSPHPAAHPSSSAIFIPSVIETSNFRTNLGMSNLTGSEANVTVELVDPQGSVLASKQYTVAAKGLQQVNHVIPDLLGTSPPTDKLGYLILESDQAINAFAVSIDNVTQDSSFMQATRGTATHLLLPTSTSAGLFKTTLTIINDGDSTNHIDLKFRDASGTLQASKSITLSPYGFFHSEDIHGFLGVSGTFGPIEMISVNATPLPMIAVARVYSEITTPAGMGTTGSFFSASPYSD